MPLKRQNCTNQQFLRTKNVIKGIGSKIFNEIFRYFVEINQQKYAKRKENRPYYRSIIVKCKY